MSHIRLVKEPNEVYFKTTTNYELEVDGRPLTIREVSDSNSAEIYYLVDGIFTESPPDWIIEMGEDDWGDLIFERTLFDGGLSGADVGEEWYTEEE